MAWDSQVRLGGYRISSPLARRVVNAVVDSMPIGANWEMPPALPDKPITRQEQYRWQIRHRLANSGLALFIPAAEGGLPDIHAELPKLWRFLAWLTRPRSHPRLAVHVMKHLNWYLDLGKPAIPPYRIHFWITLAAIFAVIFGQRTYWYLADLLTQYSELGLGLLFAGGAGLLLWIITAQIDGRFMERVNCEEFGHYLLRAYTDPPDPAAEQTPAKQSTNGEVAATNGHALLPPLLVTNTPDSLVAVKLDGIYVCRHEALERRQTEAACIYYELDDVLKRLVLMSVIRSAGPNALAPPPAADDSGRQQAIEIYRQRLEAQLKKSALAQAIVGQADPPVARGDITGWRWLFSPGKPVLRGPLLAVHLMHNLNWYVPVGLPETPPLHLLVKLVIGIAIAAVVFHFWVLWMISNLLQASPGALTLMVCAAALVLFFCATAYGTIRSRRQINEAVFYAYLLGEYAKAPRPVPLNECFPPAADWPIPVGNPFLLFWARLSRETKALAHDLTHLFR
ncbi:hypothetical protein JW859_04695 [bacterium]|nr:hypothetical protein [bacterium]